MSTPELILRGEACLARCREHGFSDHDTVVALCAVLDSGTPQAGCNDSTARLLDAQIAEIKRLRAELAAAKGGTP